MDYGKLGQSNNLLANFFDDEDTPAPVKDYGLSFAPVDDSSKFVSELKKSNGQQNKMVQFKKGTTTLGFTFKGGIILAVDSRSSMGAYNSSEGVQKVITINNRILGTMAGGAADCQYWEDQLGRMVNEYELNNGEQLSVSGASNLFSSMLYQYKGYGLSVGAMIAGFDSSGGHLYYTDNEGIRVEGDRFAIGSGGTYAYGILDTYYDYNLELESAIFLAKRAISEATYHDAGSGGVVRVYHLHEKGWTRLIEAEDNSELIWKHRNKNNIEFYRSKAL